MWRDPPRVLVVEDDPLVLELITTRLGLAGYQTFHARDGREGLRRLREVSPGCMVLDINMPKCDGFEVLRDMCASGHIKRVPTMVLTARNRPEDVKLAISLGARDFMTKPFNDQQLLARVARLLRPPAPRPPVAPPASVEI